jgi:hypothetical protein
LLPLSPLLALSLAPAVSAETTRTLRAQLAGDTGKPFAVENLAGTMRVTTADVETAVAVATIHAESDELAGLMRFEQVTGEKGVPTLRVRYPVDRYTHYRFGKSESSGKSEHEGFLSWLFNGNSNMKYDGVRVTVSGRSGVLVYADVEVQVPRKTIDGSFKNHVGPISGQGVSGHVTYDSGSGDVTVQGGQGEIKADTGSGNVTASGMEGSFVCDTGSGNCDVKGFKGDSLRCDTGSGEVRIESVAAHRVVADTGSGNIRVRGVDAEEFVADTGSGNVELTVQGSRLTRVKADTGSGDVRLRLDKDAGFEARANTGSGDVVSHYADAEAIRNRKEIVGYRRGDGRIHINVDTGSGDVVIEPVP